MTIDFEQLPQEVLELIATHVSDSTDDLRQLQITSKRCQLIAEKHLFERLVLSGSVTDRFALFSGKPHRCNFVKTLCLSGEQPIFFDDEFFAMFRNIETVGTQRAYRVNWQDFNKTFTPERCALKQLPEPFDLQETIIEPYIKALQDHSPTLEILRLMFLTDSNESRLREYISSGNLSQLKAFSFRSTIGLQDLDALLDKHPHLEDLELRLPSDAKNQTRSQIHVRQHQRLMKTLHLYVSFDRFLELCTYFITKFPRVREWTVCDSSSYTLGRENQVAPFNFEEYADILRSMMKSMKVLVRFATTFSSLPKALGLAESYGPITNIVFYYQPQERGEFKVDSVDLVLHYSRIQNASSSIQMLFTSNPFHHLYLFEKFGHHLYDLMIALPYGDEFGYTDDQEDLIGHHLQLGGIFGYLLDNCPKLITLDYQAGSLNTVGTTNKAVSLKKLSLHCDSVAKGVFLALSSVAPNITDLVVHTNIFSLLCIVGKRSALIDMPKNSFDRLMLIDLNECIHEGSILLHIITSSGSRYYFQENKYGMGSRRAIASISQEKYKIYCEMLYKPIIISCRSIRCLEYAVEVGTYDAKPVFKLEL